MSGLRGDKWIREMAGRGMISPFAAEQVRVHRAAEDDSAFVPGGVARSVISYGVSSYGYDIRVSDEFRVFINRNVGGIVDPKHFDAHLFLTERGKGFVIVPPNSFALAASVERFRLPRNVVGLVLGKSTYARCGININCTPIEPEWEGHLTLEIANTTPLPAKVYADEGIAQVLFIESPDTCETSYADRKGKYQHQSSEPVSARV